MVNIVEVEHSAEHEKERDAVAYVGPFHKNIQIENH